MLNLKFYIRFEFFMELIYALYILYEKATRERDSIATFFI